jgi:transposase
MGERRAWANVGLGEHRHGRTSAWANIPPKANRKDLTRFSRFLYRERNCIERFFKHFRRIATRYTKLA